MAAIVGSRGTGYCEETNSSLYSIYKMSENIEILMRRLSNSIAGSEGRYEIPQMFLEEECMYNSLCGYQPDDMAHIENCIVGSAMDMKSHIRIFAMYDTNDLDYINFKVYKVDADGNRVVWDTIFVPDSIVDSVEEYARLTSILVDHYTDCIPRVYYVGDDIIGTDLYNMNMAIMHAKFDAAKIKILDNILDLKYKDEEEVVRGLNEYKNSDELIKSITRFVYKYVIEKDPNIYKFFEELYRIFYEYQTGGKEDAES